MDCQKSERWTQTQLKRLNKLELIRTTYRGRQQTPIRKLSTPAVPAIDERLSKLGITQLSPWQKTPACLIQRFRN